MINVESDDNIFIEMQYTNLIEEINMSAETANDTNDNSSELDLNKLLSLIWAGLKMIIGGSEMFRPYKKMWRDVPKTFKRYKPGGVWKDILQPLRGIGNVIKGLAGIVGFLVKVILSVIINVIILPIVLACVGCAAGILAGFAAGSFVADVTDSGFLGVVVGLPAAIVLGVAGGIGAGALSFVALAALTTVCLGIGAVFTGIESGGWILRGATQVIATPFAWLRALVIRGPLTAFKGSPKIEEGASIQREIKSTEDLLEKLDPNGLAPALITQLSATKIHDKYIKRADNDQPTDINREAEVNAYAKVFDEPTADNRKNFFDLFEPAVDDGNTTGCSLTR